MKKIVNTKIGRTVIMLPVIVLCGFLTLVCIALFFVQLIEHYVVVIIAGIINKERVMTTIKVMAALANELIIKRTYSVIAAIGDIIDTFIKTGTLKEI